MNVLNYLVKQMNKLVIRSRSPFLEQYTTKDGAVKWRQHKKLKLSDKDVVAHLKGERTLGCFYAGKATSFLVFDIDAQDDPIGQEIRVKGIVHALMDVGIDPKYIHVSTSGMKGYHVEVYFDGFHSIEIVADFGKVIIGRLKDYASGVELRPEKGGRRGIKLPLAVHRATKVRQQYVDIFTLEPVEDSEAYFLQIQQMQKEEIKEIIDKTLSAPKIVIYPLESSDKRLKRVNVDLERISMPINKSSKLRQEAEDLLNNGLKARGTRNASQFKIALLLKENGVPQDEAIKKMSAWIEREYYKGMTKEKNLNYLLNEVKRNVPAIYAKYKGFYDSKGRNRQLTDADKAWAAQFKNENLRKVVLALLYLGRMYHENGQFAAPIESIAQMTGLTRQTVSSHIKKLMAAGVIKMIEDYDYPKQMARRYFMAYLIQENADSGTWAGVQKEVNIEPTKDQQKIKIS